jgi:hypothetical protein
MRIKALIASGVVGAERLISHLPGGDNASRIKGLRHHLARAEYYQSRGELAEIEARIGDGEVDLKLTNGALIDAKAWTQSWWEGSSPEGLKNDSARLEVMRKLELQVTNYLKAAPTATLKLEFSSYIPPEVTDMVNRLKANPLYAGRILPPEVV